jgi:hypothetical protein
MPTLIRGRIAKSLFWRTPNHVSPPINLECSSEFRDTLAIFVPVLTKGTFVVSLGQVGENFRTIVVYTFRVEVVNPFETVARVCSHKVASGKS